MQFVIIIILLSLVVIGYCVFENQNLEVTSYQVEQENIPSEFDGLRLICLTDLHQNLFGKSNRKLLKAIQECNADAVLIAGDMITAGKTQKSMIAVSFLEELAKQIPVYYAPGNHELKWKTFGDTESYERYLDSLKEIGVIYLDNTSVTISRMNSHLTVTGLNLPLSYYNKGGKPKELFVDVIETMVGCKSQDEYTILLAHAPDYFDMYAKWGADLVLSGHNHGGILRLGKLGGVISPRYELFPHYDSGVYKKGKSVMFLSRGLGTHTIRIRIFNRPEIICIRLKTKT